MIMSERKEIIQLNGLTIASIIAVVLLMLAVGLTERYVEYTRFDKVELYNKTMVSDRLKELRLVKDEVRMLEGVSRWEDTTYHRYRKSRLNDALSALEAQVESK